MKRHRSVKKMTYLTSIFVILFLLISSIGFSHSFWFNDLEVNTTIHTFSDFEYLCLEGSWNLTESMGSIAEDSSMNENNGLLYDTAIWSPSRGINGCIFLDGVGDYIEIPDDSSLDLSTECTIMAWINPTVIDASEGQTKDYIIIAKNNVFNFSINDDGFLSFHASGLSVPGITGPYLLPYLNLWTHVAISFNGLYLILYVNGVEENRINAIGEIDSSSYPVTIGYLEDENYFHGYIDEVKMYSCALSSDEIYAEVILDSPI